LITLSIREADEAFLKEQPGGDQSYEDGVDEAQKGEKDPFGCKSQSKSQKVPDAEGNSLQIQSVWL
jgi:hypothetical protein